MPTRYRVTGPVRGNLSCSLMMAATVVSSVFCSGVQAQEKASGTTSAGRQTSQPKSNYPPPMEGADAYVYKSIDKVQLIAYVYSPTDHQASDKAAVAVFFFGGGWKSGSPAQFEEHCKYLASRGMVAIAADYRVASRHGVKAVDCVEDAKSAIRWVRASATKLGVDPNRVVAAGGSAGGHLAACIGVMPEQADDEFGFRPNAMALFNPALVLAPIEGESTFKEERREELTQRMGTELIKLSPYHLISGKVPPSIIFHGEADTTVPYRTAELFCEAAREQGSQCRLVGYENAEHGFFNYGRDGGENYRSTVAHLDSFLVSLGYLPK